MLWLLPSSSSAQAKGSEMDEIDEDGNNPFNLLVELSLLASRCIVARDIDEEIPRDATKGIVDNGFDEDEAAGVAVVLLFAATEGVFSSLLIQVIIV